MFLSRYKHFLLLACFVFCSFKVLRAQTNTLKISRTDKVDGALLMSIYGDALGLPYEFNQDVSASAAAMRRLHVSQSKLKSFQHADPWGVWPEHGKAQKAYLSDDSYFKLDVLKNYLKWLSRNDLKPSDIVFTDFVATQLASANKSRDKLSQKKPGSIGKARNAHYAGWKTMMVEMLCSKTKQACSYAKQITKGLRDGRSFYEKGSSKCFGLFMYTLMGLWNSQVGEQFVTGLDSEDGQILSAYFRDLIAYAAKNGHFSYSLLETEKKFQKTWSKKLPKRLLALRRQAFLWSEKHSQKPVRDLWVELKKERQKNLPKWVVPIKFCPAEFAFVFWGALGLDKKNALDPLIMIANAGGDTDTIASLYGSFIGAHHGLKYFKKSISAPLKKIQSQLRESNLSVRSLRRAIKRYSKDKRYSRLRSNSFYL